MGNKLIRALAFVALLFVAHPALAWTHGSAAASPGSCWTVGSDGFMVVCSTAKTTGTCSAGTSDGTCIVSVDFSNTGGDATCDAEEPPVGSNIAGGWTPSTWSPVHSCQTLAKAVSLSRTNKPDWILLKKGQTWTDVELADINRKGVSASAPFQIGAYGTGARPLMKTDTAANFDSGCIYDSVVHPIDYLFITSIECYNYKADPNGGSFNPGYNGGSGNSGFAFQTSYNWLWIEDVKLSFYVNDLTLDGDSSNSQQPGNTYIRRSVFVDTYSSGINGQGHSQGIHTEFHNPNSTYLIEENLFDQNGFYTGLLSSVTATITIANPAVITATLGYTPVFGQGVTFHSNSDSLPTGITANTACYYILEPGVDGANKFRLSATPGNNAQFTGSITTTTLTTTATQTLNTGDVLVGSGVANNTYIVTGGTGTSFPVSVSQTVSAGTFMQTFTELVTSGTQSGTHKVAWDCAGGSPQQTIFNHCLYVDSQNPFVTYHGNIVARCSDNGIQGRPSGEMKNNLITLQPEAGFVAGAASSIHDNAFIDQEGPANCATNGCPGTTENNGPSLLGTGASMTNNLIANAGTGSSGADAIQMADSHDDCGRISVTLANPAVGTNAVAWFAIGQAFAFDATTCGGTLPSHITQGTTYYATSLTPILTQGSNFTFSLTPNGTNISTLGDTQSGNFRPLGYSTNNSATANVIWNYGNASGAANITNTGVNSGTNTTSPQTSNQNLGGTCAGSDCTRTIGSYNAQLSDCASLPGGCTATTAAFLTSARAQSRDNWRTELMAQSVNTYLGVGYGVTFH